MSNIIAKIRQRIALKDKSKFDLSCDHITTTDFFHISPVYIKEMVPGENIKINLQTFTRLAPLVNPMLGRARITNRAFFVPMRTIFKGWNEFITNVPVDNKFLNVPLIQPDDIAWCFTNPALSDEVTPSGSATVNTTSYDFGYTPSGSTPQGTGKYYKLNDRGRKAWKIMTSLGYRLPLGYWSGNASSQGDEFSALPILAYAKIFKDWYQNQAYTTNVFDLIFEISKLSSGVPYLTGTQLLDILNYCTTATYDKDYFTSAWDRATSPNNGLSSGLIINDITNDSTSTTSGTPQKAYVRNGGNPLNSYPTTPSIGSFTGAGVLSTTAANITQYAIDTLKALTDYLKRHQLAGGLAMDRMMSRFGMKPSDAALDRSIYLGKDEVNVLIADVMATSSGVSSASAASGISTKLGEYAGKGLGYSENGWFNYSTEEYGFLIIISVLTPHVGYVQGCSRINLHKDRLDFFTPEFDSLGVQAISRKELMSDYKTRPENDNLATLTAAAALDGVFGYTSRYAEYKTAQDNLTGDFTLNTRNVGLDSWHLYRMFDADGITLPEISHNFAFVEGETAQYDRVFAYKDGNNNISYDHFYVIHHFNVEDYAPMSQLFDDYLFDGGNKQVNIEVNGTQLN